MLDWQTETLVSFTKAPKSFPGHPPHISTLHRWRQRRDSALETIKIAGRLYTSEEAIARFIAADNGAPPPPASKGRRRRIAAAEAELEAAGV